MDRNWSTIILALGFAASLLVPTFAQQAPNKRVALVIGNAAYEVGRLENPTNDADAMAAALATVGFTVTKKKDRTKSEMEDDIDSITTNLNEGDLCLIFFAGHGMEIKGENFLVPIGAKVTREHHVKQRCVKVSYLLDAMDSSEASLKVVIADCCRDNPFRSFVRSSASRMKIEAAPRGTIVSFSTSPGNVAFDGEGKNSPFTKFLTSAIYRDRQQGLEIVDMFRIAGRGVNKEMGQRPFLEFDSTMDNFYLKPPKAGATMPAVASEKIKVLTLLGDDKITREQYNLWVSLDRRRDRLSEIEKKQLQNFQALAEGDIDAQKFATLITASIKPKTISKSTEPKSPEPKTATPKTTEPKATPTRVSKLPSRKIAKLGQGQPFVGSLTNTKWICRDSDNDQYEILFLADGELHYQHKRGPRRNGKWSLQGTKVTININEYTTMVGEIRGQQFSGSAVNLTGKRWNFSAVPSK